MLVELNQMLNKCKAGNGGIVTQWQLLVGRRWHCRALCQTSGVGAVVVASPPGLSIRQTRLLSHALTSGSLLDLEAQLLATETLRGEKGGES